MTKEEFNEIIGKGFSVKLLGDAFNDQNPDLSCAGRIFELKNLPDVKYIATELNTTVEEVERVLSHINTDAIYDFAVKYSIDLDAINYEPITQVKERKAKVEHKVGDKTIFGIIEQISKVGSSFVYLIRTTTGELVMKSTKEMKA